MIGRIVRVLIVEDHAAIARGHEHLVRRHLTHIGCASEVVITDTAEAAIAKLAVENFDLVISDFDLAGTGTGGDVLRAVRADLDRPRFVFVSGSDDAAILAAKHGVPYLDKPCSPTDLRNAITAELAA